MRKLLVPYTSEVNVVVCVERKIFVRFHDEWFVSFSLQVIDDAFDCFLV
jgi:hypothetical protein